MSISAQAEILKFDEAKRLVFGWANVIHKDGETVIDRQDDFIDSVDELEATAYDYVMESRDGGEQHARFGVSDMVESFVVTPEKLTKLGLAEDAVPTGWWVGFKVKDPRVWEGVEKGYYTGFSIGGSGYREKDAVPLGKGASRLGDPKTWRRPPLTASGKETEFRAALEKRRRERALHKAMTPRSRDRLLAALYEVSKNA